MREVVLRSTKLLMTLFLPLLSLISSFNMVAMTYSGTKDLLVWVVDKSFANNSCENGHTQLHMWAVEKEKITLPRLDVETRLEQPFAKGGDSTELAFEGQYIRIQRDDAFVLVGVWGGRRGFSESLRLRGVPASFGIKASVIFRKLRSICHFLLPLN